MNKRIDSSFENFFEETGLKDAVEGLAQKRVYAWQMSRAMENGDVTKVEPGKRTNASD